MKLTAFFIALLCCTALAAQREFSFIRFTTDDNQGLNSNVVYSVYQSGRGFIWVGTANGLQRFDGGKFISYDLDEKKGQPLPNSGLTQIVPDSSALLLLFPNLREIGLFNPLSLQYRKCAVRTQRPLPHNSDYRLWKDAQGRVFLNVFNYGLLHYNRHNNSFEEQTFYRLPPGYMPAQEGLFEDTVKNQVWFACNKGLCVWDSKRGQMWYSGFNPQQLPLLKQKSLQDNPTQFHIDRQRRIWVFGWPQGGTAGQYKWCLDSTGTTFLKTDTAGLHIRNQFYTEYNSFFESVRSGLWVYGLRVLLNADPESNRFTYSPPVMGAPNNSIDYEDVNEMIEDRDGNLWFATDRGLYYSAYQNGTISMSNMWDDVNEGVGLEDVLELPNGDMWFAFWGKGVRAADSMWKPKSIAVYNNPPPAVWSKKEKDALKLTWTLHRQKANGHIWMGCQSGVLMVHDPIKSVTKYLLPAEAGGATIRHITEDRQGSIWMCTQRGALIKWNGVSFQTMQQLGTIIYKIFADNEGLLWLATQDKGVYCINPATGAIVQQWTAGANGLYSNSVRDIEQLQDGTIAVGAGALHFINKKSSHVRVVSNRQGLPSNSVQRLRADKDGYLWMITANGLARYNPYRNSFSTYGSKDGITQASLTTTTDLLTRNGYPLFGGSSFITLFNPAVFAHNQPPPDVVITDLKVLDRFLPLMRQFFVKLQHHENSFSIHFSSLSYQQRDRIRYKFMLEGADRELKTADAAGVQSYTLLPPGIYIFKVYAEDEEGRRSANITNLPIHIRPPFWRTWWFIALMVLLVALGIYALHRQRVSKLLAVEKVRHRVARDLHDDMGSTLSNINILSAMAKSKMTTDVVKTASYLSKISDNSQRMMEAMDDIVWSIKPTNDSMQKMLARMREFATSVLEPKDILLRFSAAESVMNIKLDMEARRDFFLLFKEGVNNAAKYSKATEVTVNITTKMGYLALDIVDNGQGFDVAAADDGNGLGNMQKRAHNLRGKLTITSDIGKGTTVHILAPLP